MILSKNLKFVKFCPIVLNSVEKCCTMSKNDKKWEFYQKIYFYSIKGNFLYHLYEDLRRYVVAKLDDMRRYVTLCGDMRWHWTFPSAAVKLIEHDSIWRNWFSSVKVLKMANFVQIFFFSIFSLFVCLLFKFIQQNVPHLWAKPIHLGENLYLKTFSSL